MRLEGELCQQFVQRVSQLINNFMGVPITEKQALNTTSQDLVVENPHVTGILNACYAVNTTTRGASATRNVKKIKK